MKSMKPLSRLFLLAITSCVLVASLEGSASAQGNQPINLDFVGVGGGPPNVVVLADGTVIFKVTVIEAVSGELTGTLTERVTQVYPLSDEDGLLPITTFWKLETAEGTIEGYYGGEFNHLRSGDHMITQHGEVLSVTGAYVSLYQAKVSYKAVLLADHMTISGAITIHPREKR